MPNGNGLKLLKQGNQECIEEMEQSEQGAHVCSAHGAQRRGVTRILHVLELIYEEIHKNGNGNGNGTKTVKGPFGIEIRGFEMRDILRLAAMGLIFYAIAKGHNWV